MIKHLIYSKDILAVIKRAKLDRRLIKLSSTKPKYQITYCKICGKEYCKSLPKK